MNIRIGTSCISEPILGSKNPKYYSKDEILSRYKKAVSIYEKLGGLLILLGPNNIQLARPLHNIGSIEGDSDPSKSIPDFRRVLRIWLNELGENHGDTAHSYFSLGIVYTKTKNYADALGPSFMFFFVAY
jgi:tetratricopeptide (TPR) repeat protein